MKNSMKKAFQSRLTVLICVFVVVNFDKLVERKTDLIFYGRLGAYFPSFLKFVQEK